jgi:hypothetical protein
MDFTTPVGKLVQGDCFNGSDKDRKGVAYIIKTGPNAGKPTKKFFFAVAFPKVLANGAPNEEFNTFYRAVIDVARVAYPQFFNGQIDPFTGKQGCTHPRMALKIADGDGNDEDGKPNSQKPGHAGHWVVKFSGSYAPRCFELGKFLPSDQLTDSTQIKRGYFVSVSGTVEGNIGSDVPGVYMNGNLVCLVGKCHESEVITSGPDASAAFANIPMGSLPNGCVPGANPSNAVPSIPNAGGVPSVPGASSVPAVPGTVPNVTAYVAPVVHDPLAVAVANGWIVHPTTAGYFYKGQEVKTIADVSALYPAPSVPVVPAIPVAPVASGPVLTAAGAALGTYESFRANSWTDDMMRQHGYLV